VNTIESFDPEAESHREAYQNPFYSALYQRISQLLATALVRGEIIDLDVPFTAYAILAAMTPSLYAFQLQSCSFSRERIMLGIRRLFIDGLQIRAQSPTDPEDKG